LNKVPSAAPRSADVLATRGSLQVNGKLAATVAARIVDEVAARGWPVGEVIGSEPELLERYGVSRAVFREAVRLVEHQHVARMRRGPGGGLVVTEPDVTAVIDAAVIYLLRVGARLDEVFEARLVLEEMVTDMAPGRVSEAGLAEIRALVEAEAAGTVVDQRALHNLLAHVTGNPALELFVEMLSRLTTFYVANPREIAQPTFVEANHAHHKIADAVMAGDPAVARRRMGAHLRAEAEYIRARRGTRQSLNIELALRGQDGGKRAEAVARAIFSRIVTEDLQPGALVGSEADLMADHEVSRAVLREAVRLLEHHRIAAMRRGPGGGLFVAQADVSAVSDVVAVYLNRHGVHHGHLAEMRVGVELALVDRSAEADGAVLEQRLGEALLAEEHATDEEMADVVHDLHAVIASLGGNRVLELLARILIRLTRLQDSQRTVTARRVIRAEVHRAHSGISEALIGGDRNLARHRLRRHLEVLAGELGQ
jgi:DNA-binding FadR family transcriptional regulator